MPAEAKVEISAKLLERLRRLSVVHAYDLRLKIVTELFVREMSPTQFYREFGGGSVARVERHFKRLALYGWLRLIRKESGGERRGGCEHFYRANELAIFDLETWSLLPYSVRAAYGWTTFKQLAERVREAMEAGTFDARSDRHLSSTSLFVDEPGRERVVAAADGLFENLLEEQEDAKLRIFESGETPLLVTTGMAAFDSPMGRQRSEEVSGLAESVESLASTYLRISKACGDELCLRILEELNLREMSVTQFHREIGGASKSAVRHRFNMLEQLALLGKVGKRMADGRRGPREHVYRAVGPALSGDGIWSGVPSSIRTTDSWAVFGGISDSVKEAIRVGTFDARADRHLTWSLLLLDRIGWERSIAAIETNQAFLAEEQEGAWVRLAESGEAPIKMTVATMAFESPKNSAKAP
jgi:DNA-binding transcriptional ArsR family regulator